MIEHDTGGDYLEPLPEMEALPGMPSDTLQDSPDDAAATATGNHGLDGSGHTASRDRRDTQLSDADQPGAHNEPVIMLYPDKNGVYSADYSGSKEPATTHNGGGSGDNGGGNRPNLWRDSSHRPESGRSSGRVAGYTALLLAGAITVGYAGDVAVTDAWRSVDHSIQSIEKDLHDAGAVPDAAQSGPLKAALRPQAEAIATEAIADSAQQPDGQPGLFRATQVSPTEVVLRAGSDPFDDSAFTGQAAFVSVRLDGAGLDAAHLHPADAADVAEVFIEQTTGIRGSQGDAVDTQVDISDAVTSQARDRNDLVYAAGDHSGQEWSGIDGRNDDSNYDGYMGYSSDPNAILTGPGPKDDNAPEFDNGYWGGGSPPQGFADNDKASQVQTAEDVAAEAARVFKIDLSELGSGS